MKYFFDRAKIFVQGGRGGNGCVSFRREKFIPKGGPNGGDGGNGGNVILLVNKNLNTLRDFHYKIHYKARRGIYGKGKNMHGRNGEDTIIKVPAGTLVYDAKKNLLLGDLTNNGESLVVARGGRGGRGNASFATPTNRTPKICEEGKDGEAGWIKLELKLVSDVGLVGFPNVGKSTLLARLSNAKPKIADYPFTTLQPNLGIMEVHNKKIVIADVPGIIENAHLGKGLGLEFLRHIERTRMLVILLDITDKDVYNNYNTIIKEMMEYNPDILKKPMIVVINKIDKFKERKEFNMKVKTILISALKGANIEKLKEEIYNTLREGKNG